MQAETGRALSLLLAIDTCGPAGSVALGRLPGPDPEILSQIELKGRTYSATLISAVSGLFQAAAIGVPDLGAIVVVNGPGSFTGVRVGLSTVKGLAEAAAVPVVAVSRLEVLSTKSGIPSSALDAHRGEVFLRLERMGSDAAELLAGPRELAAIAPAPARVAVCEEGAATVLAAAWPSTRLTSTSAPLAADALRLGLARLAAGAAIDFALLDGHYLRRSDAEIFGNEVLGRQAAAEAKAR